MKNVSSFSAAGRRALAALLFALVLASALSTGAFADGDALASSSGETSDGGMPYNEGDELLAPGDPVEVVEYRDLIGEVHTQTYDVIPDDVIAEIEAIIGEIDFESFFVHSPVVKGITRDGDVMHCCKIQKNEDGSFTVIFWDRLFIAEHWHMVESEGDGIAPEPAVLVAYRDAEHKEPIEGAFTPGERVYYEIVCAEGYFATDVRMDDATFIDGESFVPGDEEPDISITFRLAGDVNSDGGVNARDITVLMKRLVGDTPTYWEYYGNDLLDFNRDGKINAKDVFALMKQIVSGRSMHGGVQKDVTGTRAAKALGVSLFAAGDKWDFTNDGRSYQLKQLVPANEEYVGKEYGYSAVIKDAAQLEAALVGAAEPTESEKEYVVSPSEYLASVDDGSFAERTFVFCSFGSENGPRFDGAYFVNETLVLYLSVNEGRPGLGCDPYEEHFMIVEFGKLPEDQPISPHFSCNYPL